MVERYLTLRSACSGPLWKKLACAGIIIILWPLFEMTYNPNEAWR